MSKPISNLPLKQSFVLLVDKFFQLVAIDALISFKKVIGVFCFSGFVLLFSFSTWAIIIYGLYEYLLHHGWSQGIVFIIVVLLNLFGLVVCLFFMIQQLKSIQFSYTKAAVNKIKTNLEIDDEDAE